jgi:hypothetical protein
MIIIWLLYERTEKKGVMLYLSNFQQLDNIFGSINNNIYVNCIDNGYWSRGFHIFIWINKLLLLLYDYYFLWVILRLWYSMKWTKKEVEK